MADQDPVTFTYGAAQRIASAVRKVEIGDRAGGALSFERVYDELPTTKKTFRICTFTGAWSTSAVKTVTFRNQTNTPNTLAATNLFFEIPDDGTKNCAVARDGTAWYLVQWQWAIATCSTAAN